MFAYWRVSLVHINKNTFEEVFKARANLITYYGNFIFIFDTGGGLGDLPIIGTPSGIFVKMSNCICIIPVTFFRSLEPTRET